jgi:hypothetical protein
VGSLLTVTLISPVVLGEAVEHAAWRRAYSEALSGEGAPIQFGWFTDQRFAMDWKSGLFEPEKGWFRKGIPIMNCR